MTPTIRVRNEVVREPMPTRDRADLRSAPQDDTSDPHRADVRLRAGTLDFREVGLVARRIADAQVDASADDRHGDPAALEHNIRERVGPLLEHIGPAQMHEIERRLLALVEAERGWLSARARRGRIVRGFGDVRLEHVHVDDRGGVRIDSGDLDDRFRCSDAIADLAMLATDLEHRGRPDLAEHLVASWAEVSGDYDAYRGLDFYTRYCAYLRAKREAMHAADASLGHVRRDVAGGRTRRLLVHALQPERRSVFAPRVIAVGGIMAAGKSTLAAALAERLGAPRVSTDRTRKQMLGVEPSAWRVEPDAWRRGLAEDLTEAVYDQMLRRGEVVLRSGRPVVLDATFRTVAFRDAARQLAKRNAVPFVFIECSTPAHVGRQRLRDLEKRVMFGDGRLEIFDEFVAGYEPPRELAEPEHIRVDTAQPYEQSIADVLATVPSWP
jgi:predicted kinase